MSGHANQKRSLVQAGVKGARKDSLVQAGVKGARKDSLVQAGVKGARNNSSQAQVRGNRKCSTAARTSREQVELAGVPVLLVRKNIKRVNLRVKAPDGQVVVSAPFSTPLGFIEAFVAEKRAWIQNQQAVLAQTPLAQAAHASKEEQDAWRAVVEACVPALVEAWEPILGVKAGKLVYRNMTSRWGSCQPATGRICINTRLALYPPECLEYVVVHELCHLIERGHGKKFYALMDAVMPDWQKRRALLR
jgi:hypothetical protein